MKSRYDVVILGAGHNGLVAAAYLTRAGLSVLLLEKNDYVGGAATSQRVFPDYDARLSRYAYLVSLFPEKIIRDLSLNLDLRRRRVASFTPYQRRGRHGGLLLSNVSEEISRTSLRALTGNDTEFGQLKRFYGLVRLFADKVWDTMLEPLVSKEEFKRRFEVDDAHREAWRSLVEEPLGRMIERYLQDDLVRGLVFTDAKIGVFTHPDDESLLQNRCFLYHLIGNKTGEWKVPAGGMGHLVGELERAARSGGASIEVNARISGIELCRKSHTVHFAQNGKTHSIGARFLLVNFGVNELARLLGQPYQPTATDEGSVFKINMLVRRLPKLRSAEVPEQEAFSGTFHFDEGYEEMKASHDLAKQGKLPARLPGEIYCHTLTDESILSPELQRQGYHTLTLFGLDTPWPLFAGDNPGVREQVQERFVEGLDRWLAEPLESCLARAGDGSLCIEGKSPVDLEEALNLYHGNIFQKTLTFPFAEKPEEANTWGVETEWENVFLCGSSARRGGAVSGIPGHNAAKKVIELVSS